MILRAAPRLIVAVSAACAAVSSPLSPEDALNMFYGSDLQNLAVGDFLVRKES